MQPNKIYVIRFTIHQPLPFPLRPLSTPCPIKHIPQDTYISLTFFSSLYYLIPLAPYRATTKTRQQINLYYIITVLQKVQKTYKTLDLMEKKA